MYPSTMLCLPRGGRREGAGAKPKRQEDVASVRVVANVTEAEAAEWQRRGRTAWLRGELRKLAATDNQQPPAHNASSNQEAAK